MVLVIWLAAVLATLSAGVQVRYWPFIREHGISVSDSFSARSVIRLSSPPLSNYGTYATVVEQGSWGLVSVAADGKYTLEIHDLENFTKINSLDKTQRRVSHKHGIYAYWDIFVNDSRAPGVLKFKSDSKTICTVAVEIRNLEYLVEPKILELNFRTLTINEAINDSRLQNKGSCLISSGRIENLKLEFWGY